MDGREAVLERGGGRFFKGLHLSDVFLFLYLCAMFGHRTGAGFDFYFLRIAFVAYIVAFFLFDVAGDIRKRRHKKLFGPYSAWFFAFWLFALVSVLWSHSIKDALPLNYVTNVVQAFFLLTFLLYRIETRDDFIRIATVFVVACLYGCLRLYQVTPSSAWGSERVGGALGLNSNSVGLSVAFATLFSFFLLRETKKIVYALIMAPFIVVALFSGSRKALVLVMLGLVLMSLFGSKGIKAVVGALVAVAACAALYNLVMTNDALYKVLGYRIDAALNFYGGNAAADGSAAERMWYREYAAYMLSKSPIVGYGFNGFVIEMARIGYWHIAYCHCNQWELLADLGTIGFCAYYGVFVYAIRRMYLAYKVAPERRNAAFFGITLLSVVFIMDYGYVSFVDVDIYLYLALVFALSNVISKRKEGALRGQAAEVRP